MLNFGLIFSIFLKLCGLSASFFNLSQISKQFSNILTENNPYISTPMQFKPMFFKGQLHMNSFNIFKSSLLYVSFMVLYLDSYPATSYYDMNISFWISWRQHNCNFPLTSASDLSSELTFIANIMRHYGCV